ncbi:DNA polymerase delta subunit 2 [Salvia divinorum]|uniref:DNA polymerase delta subunit 2 n=1 Tax=Salvia divinorum TaxID=28513 RepID=A0ABD1H0T4_SALDI
MKRQQLKQEAYSSPHQIVKDSKNGTKAEHEEAMIRRATKGLSSGGRRGQRDSDLLRNEMAATSARSHYRRKTMPPPPKIETCRYGEREMTVVSPTPEERNEGERAKPSILDEYSKERSASTLVQLNNVVHSDDYLVLDDKSGRIKLSGGLHLPSVYVTGIVVALHGKETGAGDFEVEDVLEAVLPHQIDRPLNSGEDKFIVFVSGLSVGSTSTNPLRFQLFVDHITGYLGDLKEQGMSAQIVRVVIAGISSLGSRDQSKLSEPIKELDILTSQIAASIPVDIMLGEADCKFRIASAAFHTFRSCTNPNSFELDNVRVLGTSGQNIDDLAK